MPATNGINHLGLAVKDLDATTHFFVDYLDWQEAGRDNSYPRTSVTDGKVRLTLWQIDHNHTTQEFDRRSNIGLHHLALSIDTENELNALAEQLSSMADVTIEFMPELAGDGPRKHMMCNEPGGIRIEFIWQP